MPHFEEPQVIKLQLYFSNCFLLSAEVAILIKRLDYLCCSVWPWDKKRTDYHFKESSLRKVHCGLFLLIELRKIPKISSDFSELYFIHWVDGRDRKQKELTVITHLNLGKLQTATDLKFSCSCEHWILMKRVALPWGRWLVTAVHEAWRTEDNPNRRCHIFKLWRRQILITFSSRATLALNSSIFQELPREHFTHLMPVPSSHQILLLSYIYCSFYSVGPGKQQEVGHCWCPLSNTGLPLLMPNENHWSSILSQLHLG